MKIIKNVLFSFLLIALISNVSAQSVEEGLRLTETERTQKAVEFFDKMLQANSADPKMYFYKGYALIKNQQPQPAEEVFNKGITTDPKQAINYAGLGYAFLKQNKEAEAITQFDKVLSMTKSKNPDILMVIAEAYMDKEKPDAAKAIELLNKAKSLSKSNAKVFNLLGDAYFLQNNGGLAVSNYERAVEINKNLPGPFMKIGSIYAKNKATYDLALENFNKTVAIDPNYTPVYKELGELYFKQRYINKAKEAYRKYMEFSEDKEASRSRYASFLFLAKDYDEANKEITQDLAANPNNIYMLRLLGYSSYETKDYKKGMEAMKKFFSLAKPEMQLAGDFEYYGKLLIEAGQDSLGRMNLAQGIAIDSSKVELYQAIAESYYRDKNFPKADSVFSIYFAKAEKPAAQDCFSWGRSVYATNNYQKADSVFKKFSSMQPEMTLGYLWQGRSLANMDPEMKEGLAKGAYDKLAEIALKDPENHKGELVEAYRYFSNYAFTLQKDKNQAIKYQQMILEIDPRDAQALEAVKILKKAK